MVSKPGFGYFHSREKGRNGWIWSLKIGYFWRFTLFWFCSKSCKLSFGSHWWILECLKKKKNGFLKEKSEIRKWNGVWKRTVHKGLKGQNNYNGFDTKKLWFDNLVECTYECHLKFWLILEIKRDLREWIYIVIMNLIKI